MEVKNEYLNMTMGKDNIKNMDMAKDVSFLDWLDMPLKKELMWVHKPSQLSITG
jgi:hypothetical protein